nr:retrovirus-related Pol polyprotein from transposon TNT 1-94 [Tanacetum cinerariifolium]
GALQKECKAILAKTIKSLGESISVRDSCLVALQTKQTEFEKYKAFNDRIIDYDKLKLVKEIHDELIKQSLLTKSHYEGLVKQKIKVITDLKLREEHDIEKMLSMEKQLKFLNKVVYKRSQSIQTIHMMAPKVSTYNGRPTFANPKYLKQAQSEIPCLYAFPYDQSTHANRLILDGEETLALERENALDELQCLYLHKVKECDCLAQKLSKQTESVSKKVHTELLQRFAKVEKHSISLEIALQKCKEQGKFVDTKFDRPSVVRQPNAQQIPKPSVLGKPAPFSNSLDRIYFPKTISVSKANVSEGLSKPVTAQTLPQAAKKAVRVNHKPVVSRPPLKSNQLRDRVLSNNSQVKVKKTQVEVHPRIPSVSNKMKSVTACKDSLNCRTLNANDVCGTCNKCLVDSNHFACVMKMLNDVNARTKKPTAVPISTRKPKSHANKLIATSHKKTVASKSTNQKPQSYFRMLYEQTSKAWKWWIERKSPSGYKWVPKPKKQWVPKAKMQWIVQLILFIVESGCTKYMTGNLKLLCNFVEKFLGTVRFGDDQFAPILGYGDLVQGNFTINRVYYVKGLNHNLFSVGQFCDTNLEVAFRKSTCFVRDLQGNDLLIGNRGSDLYTIYLQELTSSTPFCLMAKALPTQAWLWNRRLSHLNFDYINLL